MCSVNRFFQGISVYFCKVYTDNYLICQEQFFQVQSNFTKIEGGYSFHNGKRAMGIEPTYPAWKAGALPLSYARKDTTGYTEF